MKEIKALTAILACFCLLFVIGCSDSDTSNDGAADTTQEQPEDMPDNGDAPPMPVGGGG